MASAAPALAPMSADEYLATRAKQYQGWYDRKAARSKRWYLRMQVCAVVGGAIAPCS